MISTKPYYDTASARPARFSKTYSAKKVSELAKTYEGKVKLFEDYYQGWYLIPLRQNMREGTALITATVLFSFCDALEQFRRGTRSTAKNTGEFVKAELTALYQKQLGKRIKENTVKSLIDQIYEVLRNGLHHDLTTRGIHISMSGIVTMFQEKNGHIVELWFNPSNFLDVIQHDFLEYTEVLRNKSDKILVTNFEKMFKTIFDL